VVNARAVEGRGPAHHPVNFVALFEELLGHIGAVLPRHTGDQCAFCF
jgi:hypothetical protein